MGYIMLGYLNSTIQHLLGFVTSSIQLVSLLYGSQDINNYPLSEQVHARNKPMADDIDYNVLASITEGMVGAQLANILDIAALNIMREGRTEVVFLFFHITNL
jgi:hypothetical protein